MFTTQDDLNDSRLLMDLLAITGFSAVATQEPCEVREVVGLVRCRIEGFEKGCSSKREIQSVCTFKL